MSSTQKSIVMRLSTDVTPGAAHAARSASCFSAYTLDPTSALLHHRRRQPQRVLHPEHLNAAVLARHRHGSEAVCLLGDFDLRRPPDQMIQSGKRSRASNLSGCNGCTEHTHAGGSLETETAE